MNINQLYQQIKSSAGISTDTRSIQQGMVFFALKGDSFDANEFVQTALDNGASLVVTQNEKHREHPQCYYTKDTLITLQELALLHRSQMKATVIGITGTNGKTTTKELLREALSCAGKVQATQGNLNNHIGVPLTLLSINVDTRFAIIEMGANHPGEIEFLCNIARPEFGIVTNIGRAHLEGFGSFEGVVKTKTELYRFVAEQGNSVFVNQDDPLLMTLSENQPRILYGSEKLGVNLVVDENPQLHCNWQWESQSFSTSTNLTGNYNLPNLLAAIAVGLHFGGKAAEINQKLSDYIPSNMRSQWIDTGKNKVILDAYNANPSSMAVALNNFALLKARKKLLILGDMLELGSYSEAEHHLVLEHAAKLNFDSVILIGPQFSKYQNAFPAFLFFETTEEARLALSNSKPEGFSVLLKGSRGIGVEKLKEIL